MLANGNKAQFKVIADDEGETFTVTTEDVSSSIFDSNFRNYVEFLLKYDLCQLMGWRRPDSVSYYSRSVKRIVSVQAPGPNLIMKRKLGRTWTISRLLTNLNVGQRYDMPRITRNLGGDDMIKFYLSEIAWTFINTKRCTYKNGVSPPSLYVYSSLGAPAIMGDQTTDLLRQVPYHPTLDGSFYYEPKQIQYIPLPNNSFDAIETQISETVDNKLTQFDDGATMVILHLRRRR